MTLLSAPFAMAPFAMAQQQGVVWQKDIDQARQLAKQSGKLLLIHVWTETCGPCKRLEATVFNQPTVANAIDQHFVPVKLNANESPDVAKALRITRVPTDVIVTAEGRVVDKLVSPGTPIDYIAQMTKVATREATKPGSAFDLAAAKSPYGPVLNQAYANLVTPPTAPSQHGPAALTPPATPGKTPPSSQPQANPYLAAAAKPAEATSSPASAASAAAPASSTQPAAYNSPAPAVNQTPQQQLPAGAPPLGFGGHCTVTMKQKNKWQLGDPQFGVIHQGRTYLFAGPAERDAFFGSPEEFAPALAGVDPVVAIENGKAEAGLLQYSLEFEGRFYLFSSNQSLQRFMENPNHYSLAARQAAAAGTRPTVK